MLKKNKIIIAGLFLLSMLYNSEEEVMAKNSQTNSVKIENVGNVSVEVLDDERIAPINNVEELNEYQLDLILQKIGYSSELINTWDIERKEHLASYGGKVVDSEITQLVHEYISADGKRYIVNPENKNKIREIQLNDLKKVGVESEEIEKFNVIEETSPLFAASDDGSGVERDGKWSGYLTAAYIGETANDFKYVVMMDYIWDSDPLANFGDNAGLHWGTYGQPIAGTAQGIHATNYLEHWVTLEHTIDLSSVFGISSEFKSHDRTPGPQMGFLSTEIAINKDFEGNMLTLAGSYSHPWVPNDWSISVGYEGLGFSSSIGMGDEWSWLLNFIP